MNAHLINKTLLHVQRFTTDGERAIAPAVPELIKKQDHTLVQSRERGAVMEGRKGCRAWTNTPPPNPKVLLRSDNSPPMEILYPSFVCLGGNRRSVLRL